jgi:hypothetical protein
MTLEIGDQPIAARSGRIREKRQLAIDISGIAAAV